MKTFVALNFLIWALICTSGGSNMNQQSKQVQARNTPVGVGDVAPDFTLEDQNGQKVKLLEARGKSPVVLVFYRGYW
jgi:cytochrome oxidase Cu insertion factor (SCO1/SenC/PrrC family)